MTPAEEFAKLNNIHWHDVRWENPKGEMFSGNYRCSCGLLSTDKDLYANSTFSHPEEILEVMMKREDYGKFLICGLHGWTESLLYMASGTNKMRMLETIPIEYITVDGKLLTAALEWCREHPLKEGV
jgi:hypothetical protein